MYFCADGKVIVLVCICFTKWALTFSWDEKDIIHHKSCSDIVFIYIKYNGTECGIYKM